MGRDSVGRDRSRSNKRDRKRSPDRRSRSRDRKKSKRDDSYGRRRRKYEDEGKLLCALDSRSPELRIFMYLRSWITVVECEQGDVIDARLKILLVML